MHQLQVGSAPSSVDWLTCPNMKPNNQSACD